MSFDVLKWDAFILIRMPVLLEKLAVLMRLDTSQLKTPTDTYKAFDKLLNNERILLGRFKSCLPHRTNQFKFRIIN